MIKIHRLISTCFGIGYIKKGGGTVAAVATCIVWYICGAGRNESSYVIEALVTVLIFFLGVWSGNIVEEGWGKDSYRVVIDEVAGMALTLVCIPAGWQSILTGLVLFRFFDIAKPLGIKKMEELNGGWGVMLDDMLAGLYANIVLQIIVMLRLWQVY